MGAALSASQGVNLIDDHRADVAQDIASRGRQHQEERLRGGDQDVRWPSGDRTAFARGRVPRPYGHRHTGWWLAEPERGVRDAGQRCSEVSLHINRQCLERGDVEHSTALFRGWWDRIPGKAVKHPEEGGERLA